MRHLLVLLTCALLLSLFALPAVAQEGVDGVSGLIAFIAYTDTNDNGVIEPVSDNGSLWVIDAACAAEPETCSQVTVTLTAPDSDERDPAWSPDGTRIAYASHTDLDGNGVIDKRDFLNLYTFTPADGSITRVTNSFTLDQRPSWSSDGQRMTFQSTADTNGDAFVTFADLPAVNVINAGGGGRTLVASGVYSVTPAWSPDGTVLAYVAFAEDALAGTFVTSLFLIGPDGGGRAQITGAGSMDRTPVWSPDGTRIAFVTTTDTNGDGVIDPLADNSSVAVTSRDGGGLLTLAASDPFPETLAWSPDGARIAYVYQGQLYTVDSTLAGSTVQLTGEGFDAESPTWSPDGRAIAFTSGGRLYVIPADGGTAVAITPADFVVAQPRWSPAVSEDGGPTIQPPENLPTETPAGTG